MAFEWINDEGFDCKWQADLSGFINGGGGTKFFQGGFLRPFRKESDPTGEVRRRNGVPAPLAGRGWFGCVSQGRRWACPWLISGALSGPGQDPVTVLAHTREAGVHPEVVGEVGQVRTVSANGKFPDRAIYVARSARHRAGGDGAARRPPKGIQRKGAKTPGRKEIDSLEVYVILSSCLSASRPTFRCEAS
jgi:hypothetical protein